MDFLKNLLTQKVAETIARQLLTSVGTLLIGDGVLSSSQVNDGTGAVMVLASIGWSVINAVIAHQNSAVVKTVAADQGTTPAQVRKDLGL